MSTELFDVEDDPSMSKDSAMTHDIIPMSGAPPQLPAGTINKAATESESGRMVYFKLLHINPMHVQLTFRASSVRDDIDLNAEQSQQTEVDVAKQDALEAAAASDSTSALERVLRSVGAVGLSNVNNVPVSFNILQNSSFILFQFTKSIFLVCVLKTII